LIISGFGYSRERTALLASPQAAVATFFAIACSAVANHVPNIRCLIWALSTLPGLVGAVLIRGKCSVIKLSQFCSANGIVGQFSILPQIVVVLSQAFT
jgi:hypothetical protein